MVLLNVSSINAFAETYKVKVYSNKYSKYGVSTTSVDTPGCSLYIGCKFLYSSNELNKTFSVYRDASLTGPTYLSVGASSQHVIYNAKEVIGTHRVIGRDGNRFSKTTKA